MRKGRTYIIAEAGVNHNGSMRIARQLVDVAWKAGADAVKFQSFRASSLVTPFARKARYQVATTGNPGRQYEMLRALQLSETEQRALAAHARRRGIQFISSPFDLASLRFLLGALRLPVIKIASGESVNAPLVLEAARSGRRLIVSTGMCTLGEVEETLGVIAFGFLGRSLRLASREAFRTAYANPLSRDLLRKRVVLLHCTTEYPADPADVNLRAMDALALAFGLDVGYSDHTEGIDISTAAVARGAKVIEKHFTLDRSLPGPDHKASLDPGQLTDMVRAIRSVEAALGNGIKAPAAAEARNRDSIRRSLVAKRAIHKGERMDIHNLTTKRPGDGLSPILYWDMLGSVASRDYQEDEQIKA